LAYVSAQVPKVVFRSLNLRERNSQRCQEQWKAEKRTAVVVASYMATHGLRRQEGAGPITRPTPQSPALCRQGPSPEGGAPWRWRKPLRASRIRLENASADPHPTSQCSKLRPSQPLTGLGSRPDHRRNSTAARSVREFGCPSASHRRHAAIRLMITLTLRRGLWNPERSQGWGEANARTARTMADTNVRAAMTRV